MRRASWAPWIGWLALCGCAAGPQYFEPAERVQGQTIHGDSVAIYRLTAAGRQFGEAKLWSQGAYETDGKRNVVHVGFEIHNTGELPIELRANDLRLDVMDDDRGPLSGLRSREGNALQIAPGAIADASFLFELPPGLAPRNLIALRLHWNVHAGDKSYAQRTPFVEQSYVALYEPPFIDRYPCWPYGAYDCLYMYPYAGVDVYRPVFVRRVPVYKSPRVVRTR